MLPLIAEAGSGSGGTLLMDGDPPIQCGISGGSLAARLAQSLQRVAEGALHLGVTLLL